jgi:integrase
VGSPDQDRCTEAKANLKLWAQRRDLHDQIIFLTSVACRVGELLSIRFRDCKVEKRKGGELELVVELRGKRGHRVAIGAGEAAAIVKRRSTNHDPADLVFPDNRRAAFKHLLKAAKLYRDADGFSRNLKSLRSTGISFRILAGDDLLMIARNCGVSLNVIDQFYARKLTSLMGREKLGRSVLHAED